MGHVCSSVDGELRQTCPHSSGVMSAQRGAWEMPRASVDIDLTYVPLRPRDPALDEMSAALRHIGSNIEENISGCMVRERVPQDRIVKLHATAQ